MEVCQAYLPDGGDRTKPTAAGLEVLRHITQCVRDKGFREISDPDPADRPDRRLTRVPTVRWTARRPAEHAGVRVRPWMPASPRVRRVAASERGQVARRGAAYCVAAATVAVIGLGGTDAPDTGISDHPAATAKITKETLRDAKTVGGQLAYGDPVPLASQAHGTVTWLPATGSTDHAGRRRLRVDDAPGAAALRRPSGVPAAGRRRRGPDVQQFEQNLEGARLHRLHRRQRVHGRHRRRRAGSGRRTSAWTETGASTPGRVVSPPARSGSTSVNAAARRSRHRARAAPTPAPPGGHGRRSDVADQGLAEVRHRGHGQAARRHGGRRTSHRGRRRRPPPASRARAGRTSRPSRSTVTIADQDKLGALDAGPGRRHALAERTQGRADRAGRRRCSRSPRAGTASRSSTAQRTPLRGVETGLFADGRVEVTGDGLAEGTTVGMPA